MIKLFDYGGELDEWTHSLDNAVSKVPDEAGKVVARGALNIKRGARKRVRGLRHAKRYPYSIDYDFYRGLHGPVSEIGPNKKRRQGALGNLLEFGSVNNPPHPHMRPATDEELPKFEGAMADLSAKYLEGP